MRLDNFYHYNKTSLNYGVREFGLGRPFTAYLVFYWGVLYMTYKNAEDLLCNSLYISCEAIIKSLCANAPELKIKGKAQTENFLLYIRKRMNNIVRYVKSDLKNEPMIMKAQCDNFIFLYTINPDKTSKLEIKLMVSSLRTFDVNFLTHKIKDAKGYVYFIKSEYGFKIGHTSNLKNRLKTFGVVLPFKIEQHSYVECIGHDDLEQLLHKHLSHKRIIGEWFQLCDDDFIEIDIILKNMKLKRICEEVKL